ncbi:hypothetical protein [Streptomyces mesophilus]|uniref:hypothetical protein n=1 Tax=Streptomyces mesophilus TaxID=1775132 RepID=UPI00332A6485
MSMPPGRNPRLNEDLRFGRSSGPPLYCPSTDKPVQYLTVVDALDRVVGYAFAGDEDDAGGFCYRKVGGDEAYDKSVRWARMLRDAKAEGLAPTEALARLAAFGGDEDSRVVPGPPLSAPDSAYVKELADPGTGFAPYTPEDVDYVVIVDAGKVALGMLWAHDGANGRVAAAGWLPREHAPRDAAHAAGRKCIGRLREAAAQGLAPSAVLGPGEGVSVGGCRPLKTLTHWATLTTDPRVLPRFTEDLHFRQADT